MQTLVSGCIMQTLAYCIFRLHHADYGTVCLCFTQTKPYTYFKQRQTVFSGCVMQTLAQSASALPKLKLTPMSSRGRLCFQVVSCRLWHARICMIQPENTVCLCFTQTETYTYVKQRQTMFSGCVMQTLACQSLHDAT